MMVVTDKETYYVYVAGNSEQSLAAYKLNGVDERGPVIGDKGSVCAPLLSHLPTKVHHSTEYTE